MLFIKFSNNFRKSTGQEQNERDVKILRQLSAFKPDSPLHLLLPLNKSFIDIIKNYTVNQFLPAWQ